MSSVLSHQQSGGFREDIGCGILIKCIIIFCRSTATVAVPNGVLSLNENTTRCKGTCARSYMKSKHVKFGTRMYAVARRGLNSYIPSQTETMKTRLESLPPICILQHFVNIEVVSTKRLIKILWTNHQRHCCGI